ncbi:hypothetical protein ACRRTK_012440 [Alexandromys fortis]
MTLGNVVPTKPTLTSSTQEEFTARCCKRSNEQNLLEGTLTVFPRALKPYSYTCLPVDLKNVSSEEIQDADTIRLQE